MSTKPSTPDEPRSTHFMRAEAIAADLHPKYKGWRCTSLTTAVEYMPGHGPRVTIEVPYGMLGAIMYPPDALTAPASATPVLLFLPDALFDTPTRDGVSITPAMLEEALEGRSPTYALIPGTTITVCTLLLKGGMVVTGQSACIDKRNFDWTKSKEISLQRAQDAAYVALAARVTGSR